MLLLLPLLLSFTTGFRGGDGGTGTESRVALIGFMAWRRLAALIYLEVDQSDAAQKEFAGSGGCGRLLLLLLFLLAPAGVA